MGMRWHIDFKNSISGWYVVKATNRLGDSYKGRDLPSYVREYLGADDRGFVRSADDKKRIASSFYTGQAMFDIRVPPGYDEDEDEVLCTASYDRRLG